MAPCRSCWQAGVCFSHAFALLSCFFVAGGFLSSTLASNHSMLILFHMITATHSLTPSLLHSFTPSLLHSFTPSHTDTCSHTHTLTHTHAHSLSLTASLPLFFLCCFSSCTKELEVVLGDEHISFTTSKIGSMNDVNDSKYVRTHLLFLCNNARRTCTRTKAQQF